MELQLVKKYDARAWDGVVVPLGEGNLNSYQGPWEQELAAVRASGRFLKEKRVRFSAFLFFRRAC